MQNFEEQNTFFPQYATVFPVQADLVFLCSHDVMAFFSHLVPHFLVTYHSYPKYCDVLTPYHTCRGNYSILGNPF